MSQKFVSNRNYFHTFSKVGVQQDMYVFQAKVKGGHTVASGQVWAEADKLPAADDFASLKALYTANANGQQSIMQLYQVASLSPIADSNVNNKYQAWQLLDGNSKPVSGLIAPTDVMNSAGQPSMGYTAKLYKQDGTTEIDGTDGNWVVDYFSGLVLFQKGKQPQTMGWGNIKFTVFAYIGKSVGTVLSQAQEITRLTYTILV